MAALTKDRNTKRRDGVDFNDPAAAAVKFYAGGIVCLDASGNATPGATAVGLIARGVARENVDNSAGLAGDLNVPSMKGTFHFANDGTIDRANIGDTAYIVDDQTVADNNGATRSALGVIDDVDADGVWVKVA